MALLQFVCEECKLVFRELVFSSKATDVVCPACESQQVKRHYQGKCYFGMSAGSTGAKTVSAGCNGNCGGCAGCGNH